MVLKSYINEKGIERIKEMIERIKNEINEMNMVLKKYNEIKASIENELSYNPQIERIINSNELSDLVIEIKQFIKVTDKIDEKIIDQLILYYNNLMATKRRYFIFIIFIDLLLVTNLLSADY